MMEQIACDSKDVKMALLGTDLRGGLVRDVGLIKDQIHEMQTAAANKKADDSSKATRALQWKMAAVAFLSILVGAVLEFLLNKL